MLTTEIEVPQVKGYGPEYSPLMIVCDYPTSDELKACKSCYGASGAMLADLLRANKYSLEKCYRSTYIKCHLANSSSKNKKLARESLEQVHLISNWGATLTEEIKSIAPNVIIAVGELSFQFLTGHRNINRYRGSILPLAPNLRYAIGMDKHIRVIPIFHPRDIFASPIAYVYTQLDIAKALRQINNTRELEEAGNLWIARDNNALIEYWKRARHGEFLVTDIETYCNFPTCASLCTDGSEAVSFPLLPSDRSDLEIALVWAKYQDILASNIPKVNQNIKYDWTVLQRLGFTINNIIGDTALAANTIYPELPKGLDFLTSIYTDLTYYKDEGKDYDPKLHDFDRMLYYNAKDSLACWQVWKAQQQDLEDLKLKHFYFNFVHPLFFHYKKVDDRGIRVDESRRFDLIDKYQSLLELHSSELNEIYGQELNVRSPKQVGVFVYDYLRCPVHTHRTPVGIEVYSTDEDTLVNLYLNEVKDEIIQKILRQIILCRKIESTLNILETPYHRDGRMRTSYNVGGTTTGRTSTGQANGWFFQIKNKKITQGKLGTAFQKLPKHGFSFENEVFGEDIREIFIPSRGYEFFSFDGSNAEGRVVCILADDNETLDYIEAGNDLHKLTASWIYQKPIDFIKKDERNMGKRARHAGNLGQSGAGLSPQVYRSITFCNQVMEKFHKNAPKVQNIFHAEIQRIISTNRVLVNPFGRRRDFLGFTKNNKHDVFKEGYSYIPQGCISDHFKQISLDLDVSAPWSYHLYEAHDGLLYEIPKGRRNEFAELINEAASREIDFTNCSIKRERRLRIPLEMEFSEENWFALQPYKK